MHNCSSFEVRHASPSPSAPGSADRMRMAELVRRSGVPRTTILYYIREGLLPPAEKPHPNQALYTQEHVERLRLIKQTQRTQRFPLDKIRKLVGYLDRGASPAAVARLNERLFATRAAASSQRRWRLAGFCRETDLPQRLVKDAVAKGVLIPLTREPELEFDGADLEIGHALRTGRELGLELDDLDFLVEHARAIAEAEMRLRERVVDGEKLERDIELTTELTDMARTLNGYVVDRCFRTAAAEQPLGRDEEA